MKVEVNDRTKVALLGEGSKVRIIGLIPNVLIVIQNFHTSESLYVMKENESVVIFKIDWMDWYQVDIRRSDNIMKIWVNDEKARIEL